jgi:hypothetical protein
MVAIEKGLILVLKELYPLFECMEFEVLLPPGELGQLFVLGELVPQLFVLLEQFLSELLAFLEDLEKLFNFFEIPVSFSIKLLAFVGVNAPSHRIHPGRRENLCATVSAACCTDSGRTSLDQQQPNNFLL